MTTIAITIPGKPLPKGRPRVVNGRAYTDPKTRGYETFLRIAMRNLAGQHNWTLPTGDVSVRIVLRFANAVHGDVDNCAKAILDAANGVLFRDDKSVRIMCVERGWATEDEPEGLWVAVATLPDDPMPKKKRVKRAAAREEKPR